MMPSEFNTLDELWIAAGETILSQGKDVGSRDGATREILGFSARLTDPTANFMFNPVRKLNPHYAGAELLWYLSGEDSVERIVPYAPQYARFTNDDKAHGAYGKRWQDHNQICKLMAHLKQKPLSRQAILVMWEARDLNHALLEDRNDLPCTIALNFICRENKLNLVATMRSNDIWLGLPYDVYAFTSLQIMFAWYLGLEVGWYQHQATSLHVYARNYEKFEKATRPWAFSTGSVGYSKSLCSDMFRNIGEALKLEEWSRKNGAYNQYAEDLGKNSPLYTAYIMASQKFDRNKEAYTNLDSVLMKSYIKENFLEKKGD